MLLNKSKHSPISLVSSNEAYFLGDKKGFIIFYDMIDVGIKLSWSPVYFFFVFILSVKKSLFSKAWANYKSYSLLIVYGKISV